VDAIAYLLFWGLVIYGFLTPKKHILLYILFGCMSFGSFAVITPALTRVTLTATPIITMIFIARTLFVKDGLNTVVTYSFQANKLLYLFVFWVVATFVTISMPRFLKDWVFVIPMNLSANYAVPLEPTTQNFTQLVYISISILAVYAFGVFLQDMKMRQYALKAVCVGAIMVILTGILDFSSQFLPLETLLNPFRNAAYGMLTNVAVLNSKRVVGLMPEASSFGNLSLGFLSTLYFFRKTIENDKLRERIVPILIVLLLVMVWISTSSSAYVGLGAFGVFVILEWLIRAHSSKKNKIRSRGLIIELWLFNIFLIAFLLVVLFKPELFDPAIEMVDTMVFKKSETGSFEERNMWTSVSWQALIDSYGLGVGLGGTRASNGVVVLMSSVGILGAFFYYGFLLQTFFRRAAKEDIYGDVMISAFRWSFLPPFVVDFLIATTPDFGVFNAFRFGLVFAISYSTLTITKY